MTATSLRNALPFRNALRVVSQNRKMTIVTCILYLLGIPLAMAAGMLSLIAETHRSKNDSALLAALSNTELYIGIGFMLLGCAVFMGLFAAINSFTETHKKAKVDMLYALPLTGTQRFFSNYIGGCLMYIVPYILSCLLGWIIMLCSLPFIAWNEEFLTYEDFIGEIPGELAMGMFGLLVLMLLYYTMSVLITVCCGTLFESIYTNILLNFLIPGTVAFIIGVISSQLDFDFEYTWHIVGFTSPIGGLFYLFMFISGELNNDFTGDAYNFAASQTISHETLPSYFRWMFIILLLSAAMLVGAWLLYKRRKAEEVGKPFVYVLAYYLMLTLGTVAILCLPILEDDFLGGAILISVVAYFIMEVIRKRGFKRFWLSIITYIATAVLTFSCFALIIHTGCFGRMNYVPASIGVSSVRLDMSSVGYDTRNFIYELEYTDRDVISGITSLHRDIVTNRKDTKSDRFESIKSLQLNEEMLKERWELLSYDGAYNTANQNPLNYPDYSTSIPYSSTNDSESAFSGQIPEDAVGNYTNSYHVSFTYYTLTGSTVHRSYSLTADELYQLLEIIRGTKLYAQATANGLYSRMYTYYSQYDETLKMSCIPQNIRFGLTNVGSNSRNTETNTHTIYLTDAPQKLLQLKEAYQADLTNMTPENFRTASIFGYLSEVPVYSTCTQTIGLLKEWGMEGFNVAERYAFCDKQNKLQYNYTGPMGLRLYAPEGNRTASVNYPHSSASDVYVKGEPAYADGFYALSELDLERFYPELWALLEAASTNYVTDEDCYVLYFCNNHYIIPKKDSALAEAVIAKGSGYGWKLTHIVPEDLGWTTSPSGHDYFNDMDEDFLEPMY